jgi:hypothetical protein
MSVLKAGAPVGPSSEWGGAGLEGFDIPGAADREYAATPKLSSMTAAEFEVGIPFFFFLVLCCGSSAG